MSICPKCGKKYFSKECMNCNNKKTKVNKILYYYDLSAKNSNNIKDEDCISNKEIAQYFEISTSELNQIFKNLQWTRQQDKWTISTIFGKQAGAKEFYNAKLKSKYVKWHKYILNNQELVAAISKLKEEKTKKQKESDQPKKTVQPEKPVQPKESVQLKEPAKPKKLTAKEKKKKGDLYEEYVAKHYRNLGFFVWEHGKMYGVKDNGIDLFMKKGNCVYFVQCKNWDKWQIDHKEVKSMKTDVHDYLEKNPEFEDLISNFQKKILYVTPKKCLTPGAYKYIQENKLLYEYAVIPIKEDL